MDSAVKSPPGATLTGVVERIIFLNEENHYTIAELRPDASRARLAGRGEPARGRPVTIVGPLPGVQCGETLHLTGEWTRHAEHGDQFRIAGFRSELPSSVHGIRKYLGSGLVPGIGPAYADKIVDAFGTDTFRILSEESGKLRDVEGIGRKSATSIKKAWDEKRAERELYVFLQTYGITPNQCVKLFERYGTTAKSVLMEDPYRVARDIERIGFKTADRIAINLGFANDAAPRLDAGLAFALETLEEDGHTGYRQGDLITYAAALLETSESLIAARIDALVASEVLDRQPAPDAADSRATSPGSATAIVQLPRLAQAELRIARTIARLTRAGSGLPPIKHDAAVAWAGQKAGFEFHDLQRTGLRNALANKVAILTGGPGTGKTTILRALVEILRAKKVRVHLAAPTGRAAQRLAEASRAPASTIHRLLKYDPAGGFFHHEGNPLETDFLILDEASMLDTRLAAAILQAVPSRAHLLLVGDTDQLPSVGAGDILKDLIASAETAGIAVTRLAVIYRQKGQSQIVTAAHAINSGNASPPAAIGSPRELEPWHDLTFIAAASAADCMEKVLELCAGVIPGRLEWPHPIDDVQVLAPMHKGEAGVSALNVRLQSALNGGDHPEGPILRAAGQEFRPGDKVIQLKNNYDKGLFNGDIGVVASVEPARARLTVRFDRRPHVFERGELNELALAYCISIHKSQGSEYPIVVIPLLKAHFMMLQRNLLYTAITRGRKKVFVVGEPAAWSMAVRNAESKQRITHLRQKIAATVRPDPRSSNSDLPPRTLR